MPVSAAALGVGPTAVAGELVGRMQAMLSAVGSPGEQEQVLVSVWLTGVRSARTRRAYAADVVAWCGWSAGRNTGALAAGQVHVDLWAATQFDGGAADATGPKLRAPPTKTALALHNAVRHDTARHGTPYDRRHTGLLTKILTKRLAKTSGSDQTRRSRTISSGVSEGTRTPDTQDHNLVL